MTPPVFPASTEILQQADRHLAEGQFQQAALLYQQLIEANPEEPSLYWLSGLALLLQGEEAEAQLTWSLVLAEAELEQVEQWTNDLLAVLKREAERQEQQQRDASAWLIRRHISEINPTDLDNLLRTIRLVLPKPGRSEVKGLPTFDPAFLEEWGLLAQLQETKPLTVDTKLLNETLQQVIETTPEDPAIADLLEAYLPHITEPQHWIQILLPQATQLFKIVGNYTQAIKFAECCLKLDPNHPDTLFRLSSLYQDVGRYAEGIDFAERYAESCETVLKKLVAEGLLMRGMMSTGAQWEQATNLLQVLSSRIQDFLNENHVTTEYTLESSILCGPLYFYPYLSDDPRTTRSLQNQVAQCFQDSLNLGLETYVHDYKPYPKAPFVKGKRDKIRIGYLSRSMRMHSVGWLSRWVFKHFDRDRFEVFAFFHKQKQADFFGEEWFASRATQAFFTEGRDIDIAFQIQEQEIDILVDLDSMTSDFIVSLLAYKPAPIQVTWLGWDATGLPSVDYFIADPYVLPEDAQDYYREKIWRLPQTYIAVDGFEVGIPSLRRDQLGIPMDAVIYFSSQFAYKRHPDTVRLQMRILKEVPNSYFLVKGLGDEKAIQAFFEQIAEEEGVSCDRLRFLPREPSEFAHRANLGIADVVLDTFPYNGATTTMETLWMGVPMVTRVGKQFASRNSYAMMMNAGITEGIAHTPEEYVEWGVRLGKDAALRQQIRWRLFQSRQTSPLWDAKRFARDLETAYEQMWQHYLESQI